MMDSGASLCWRKQWNRNFIYCIGDMCAHAPGAFPPTIGIDRKPSMSTLTPLESHMTGAFSCGGGNAVALSSSGPPYVTSFPPSAPRPYRDGRAADFSGYFCDPGFPGKASHGYLSTTRTRSALIELLIDSTAPHT